MIEFIVLQNGPYLGGTEYPALEIFILLSILFFISSLYLGYKYNVEMPAERPSEAEQSSEVDR